jgi:hypothetical protein
MLKYEVMEMIEKEKFYLYQNSVSIAKLASPLEEQPRVIKFHKTK